MDAWKFALIAPCLLALGALQHTRAAAPSAGGIAFFEKRVRPVLVQHCYRCHSVTARKARGGLRLDSRPALRKGGASGPAIVPGQPARSLLVKMLRHADPEQRMPPGKPLPARALADLEAWIKMGAPDPRNAAGSASPAIDLTKARTFWSLRPLANPPVPAVKQASWPRNPVDRFILARLEARGLAPAPQADRRTLIRRLTFDLTGLPPTPEEVDAFLVDRSPGAYEKLVDRLLASPAHGERWGRHWLDLVRYADTAGCNSDYPVPAAYRYRNYVLAAFNQDKPYNRFLTEQLAGDLLPARSTAQRHEQIIATGYLAVARRFGSLDDEHHLTLEDVLDTLGKSLLGLSIGCARCHDHKFDPVLQTDYYALYGIFQGTRFAFPGTEIYRWPRDMVPLVGSPAREKELRKHLDALVALDNDIKRKWRRMIDLDNGKEKTAATALHNAAVGQRDEMVRRAPVYDKAYAVFDGKPGNARIHRKGDPENLGDSVPRGFLRVLGGQKLRRSETGSGRLELAGWITDPKNPLTARVLVNRLWQHHFGRGIVDTPNDFGTRGARPSHPELLDWLTARFLEGGWSIKKLHRLIVLSATYRMSSEDDEAKARGDPGNVLLWRFNRRRLSAEEVRDAMLAVGGGLDRSPAGAHPFPPEQGWRYTQHRPFVAVYHTDRRSVYLMQQRLKKHPYLEIFDGADPNATTPQRGTSTTALQALFLMNSPFAHAQATRFVGRLMAEKRTARQRIDRAYRLAYGRGPTAEEVETGQTYLDRCASKIAASEVSAERRVTAAWSSYLRVLFSANEFVFVE
jgi:hypothetical protein